MLAVILFILKMIGLLLLIILGAAVLALLLVLLVPFRYQAEGSFYGKPAAEAKITWLLRMLSVTVRYETEPDLVIRMFGVRLKKRSSKEEKAPEDKEEPRETTVKPQVSKSESVKSPDRKSVSEQKKTARRSAQKQKKASVPKAKKVSAIERIRNKVQEIKEKKDEIMEILHNEEYRKTFRLVKRQLFSIIRHILPQKLQGRIRFGFDDPFKTGQILTYVSPFYGLYAKHLELIPVFEESVMEGELNMKGRIRIGTIAVKAVRLVFDKNIRKLIRKVRKG